MLKSKTEVEFISDFIQSLPPKERKVLISYYNHYRKTGKQNMSAVGKNLGLSRERIRQILKRIYDELYVEIKDNVDEYKRVLFESEKESLEIFLLRNVFNEHFPECENVSGLSCLVCGCPVSIGKECSLCKSTITYSCENLKISKSKRYKAFKLNKKVYVQYVLLDVEMKRLSIPEGFDKEKAYVFLQAFLRFPELAKQYDRPIEEHIQTKDFTFSITDVDSIIGFLKLTRKGIDVKRGFLNFLLSFS